MARGFDRANLGAVPLERVVAHGGRGHIGVHRLFGAADVDGGCNFVDTAVLPPGTSIGRHRHAPTEEEYYLVLRGSGTMYRDGEEFRVASGDLVRNGPGGEHGLENDGDEPLELFVFEVHVHRTGDR